MSKRKLLTVGFQLASDDCEYAKFRSKTSLLDWDIVLFRFAINEHFYSSGDTHQGKPSLNDDASFQLKDYCAHWRKEIKQAVEAGKTVLVYLPPLEEVFVDTGQRSYSGTGRNQRTTRHVTSFNNYEVIPANLSPVTASGSRIKLAAKGAEEVSAYWHEFGSISKYEVILEGSDGRPCLLTASGDKPVGLIFRSRAANGTLLLLPDIDLFPGGFIDEEGNWTKEADQFAARFVKTVVALDRSLACSGESTPEPDWASDDRFSLPAEKPLMVKLLKTEQRLEAAQRVKDDTLAEIEKAGALRALVYEKGKPLERAIIEALRVLGFSAEPFQDAQSEFDVVFESPEGRLIGEAEGKDNKAVNVEKLRQLAMNIHEDLQRAEVNAPAKGVLFGNPFRLSPPEERDVAFTTKCETAAKSSSTALVPCPELFKVVRYLLSKRNASFARRCRLAIIRAAGVVEFPEVPPEANAISDDVAEEQ